MAKFINPFTDIGFKRIFGQEINKDLLYATTQAPDGHRAGRQRHTRTIQRQTAFYLY